MNEHSDHAERPAEDAAVARDIEMAKLCAEAMGLDFRVVDGLYVEHRPDPRSVVTWQEYRPLTNDAQAMALVKRLRLQIAQDGTRSSVAGPSEDAPWTDSDDLNRAIVECVAKIKVKG